MEQFHLLRLRSDVKNRRLHDGRPFVQPPHAFRRLCEWRTPNLCALRLNKENSNHLFIKLNKDYV